MNLGNIGAANLAWADAFVAHLAAAGLVHVVIAPGARSAPLALACLRRPELSCHVITDERSAGFFALGIGRATGFPAAVLCTSGTAAANLLPAVMEANLAGVPLLVLTADRPAGACGWGANQTVDQTRLYGSQVRASHALSQPFGEPRVEYLRALAVRLLADCRGPLPGPVHVNLPFAEPLLPEIIPAAPPLPSPVALDQVEAGLPDEEALAALVAKLSGRPGVIVCGEGDYPSGFATALTVLAEKLDAPILAEPLANLRHGAHDRRRILAHQARFLRQQELPAPAWVLRIGAFPVSRVLERWLAKQTQAHHMLIATPGRWPDPLWRSDTVLHGDAFVIISALSLRVASALVGYCDAWQQAEAAAALEAAHLCDTAPFFEGSAARELLAALPGGAHCFVGNSLAIRAVDAFGGSDAKPLTLHGNRGASGIDGNLATAAGIAAASRVPTAVLVGDQTALHDCGSLAVLDGRDIVVVVLDNRGGGIFDHLPALAGVPAEVFARGWTAAPPVDFVALGQAFGLRTAVADDAADLRQALAGALAAGGPWLIRAVIDRAASRSSFAS